MSTLKDVYGESALNFEVVRIEGDLDCEKITLIAPMLHAYAIGRFPTDYTRYAKKSNTPIDFTIDKVIFNNPATIILWKDGTKTVVKCSENDGYDPEKGLAMAICKKALGNQGNYYNVFTKHLSEYYEANAIELDLIGFAEALARMFGAEEDDG